jgi:hypothetical protein
MPAHHGLIEIIVLLLTGLRRRRSRCSIRILVSKSNAEAAVTSAERAMKRAPANAPGFYLTNVWTWHSSDD